MKLRTLVMFVLLSSLAAQAQGTVQFRNFDAATGLNAPVFLITSFGEPVIRVSGTSYMAELLAGPAAGNLKIVAQTPFLSGPQAGYFDGGMQSIPGVPSGSNAFIQVRVWTTASGSFAAAQAANLGNTWGYSVTFSVTTGTSNAPATLSPLGAFWLNPFLTYWPSIFANYNRVNGTVVVSFYDILEVSPDLVHWTDVPGNSPAIFPLNGSHFFRSRRSW